MNLGGHVKFWAIIGIMFFFVVAAVVKPEIYLQAVNRDIERIYTSHGQEGGAEIIGDANALFAVVFGETPIKGTVSRMHNVTNHEQALFGVEQRAASATNKILRTFKLELYAVMLRMSSAFTWLFALLVMGTAAFIDGLVSRKIKILGYGFTSPGIQARLAHLSVAIAGASMMLFYLPISVPLWWWPLVVITSTVSIRFIAANMKQVTT